MPKIGEREKKKDVSQNRSLTEQKDSFGITERLRIAIGIKYSIQSLIGKGSYGYVSLATCK